MSAPLYNKKRSFSLLNHPQQYILVYNTNMPSNTTSIDQTTQDPLRASAIADTNFDGSQQPGTLWIACLSPLLLAATFATALLSQTLYPVAGALSIVALCLLVYAFPSQASSRFITYNFKRPRHFVPTALALVGVNLLATASALQTDVLAAHGMTHTLAGHFAALFLALTLTAGGRYALNYIAMTQRLFVVLACWGASVVFEDTTILAVGVGVLSLNLLWSIQSRWTPMVAQEPIRPHP